ncbi:hypothetical protein B0T22DRAFT_369615 [Podospora appendiculata]|uniref:5'-3' DNA helicase ZGRF1-like N-terminal domain-containing protein n=1 Tax=Podospora appendiculata TaxID=314037 RepID=A0AAE1CI80_9PEZI|nr:hypothetical protein B0T22DRAFT_369615 [Podospora appendiculata]
MATSPSLAIAGSSAPVLEFSCLFTHDLKRKQKRWQDGRLKYHTFNKRVMVYDERGSFVGDMHWRRDWEFDEGEEVELERGGVITQVGECVGRQNQDLSELLDKRAKEKEERQAKAASRPARPPVPMHTPLSVPRPQAPQELPQSRHRHLNQLLGTPTGHHGRALVPRESPFEQRHPANGTPNGHPDPRAVKRRRYDDTPPSKMGYAQSLFGASLTLSGAPVSSAPLRRQPAPRPQESFQTSSPPENETRHPESDALAKNFDDMDILTTSRRGVTSTSSALPPHSARPRRPDHDSSVTGRALEPGLENTSNASHAEKTAQEKRISHTRKGMRSDPTNDIDLTHIAMNTKRTPAVGTMASNTSPALPMDAGTATIPPKHTKSTSLVGSKSAPAKSKPKPIIVLDDTEEEPDMRDNVSVTGGLGKTAGGAKPAAPDKQKPGSTKRKTLPSRSILPPSLGLGLEHISSQEPNLRAEKEAPEEEPRTRLRLKSRPKRGLLVAAEIATHPPSSRQHRSTTTDDAEKRHEKPVGQPTLSFNPQRVHEFRNLVEKPVPTFDEADPFASSPPDQGEISTRRSPSPPLRRQRRDIKFAEAEIGTSLDLNTLAGKQTHATSQSKPSKRMHDIGEGTGDEGNSQSPLPRRKKTKSRQETRARASRKNSERDTTSSKKPERSKSEELPQVPVGPRLAKLGRRNLKSREVIGYIESSQPVIEMPSIPASRLASNGHLVDRGPALADKESPSVNIVPNVPTSPPRSQNDHTPSAAEEKLPLMPNAKKVCPLSTPVEEPTNLDGGANQDRDDGRRPSALLPSPVDNSTAELPVQHAGRHGLGRHGSAAVTAGSDYVTNISAMEATSGAHNAVPRGGVIPETAERTNIGKQPALHLEVGGFVSPSRSLSHKSTNPPEQQEHLTTAAHSREDALPTVDGPIAARIDTTSAINSLPRIANPASRGRKAALKSHAAGQVPQPFLPIEPIPERLPARGYVVERGDGVSAGGENQRPKYKIALPGFVTAKGGGPWSREAYDLLETGRPG